MASSWHEEGNHAGHFIVGEATVGATGVSRSREVVSYAGANVLTAGTVVHYDPAAGTIVEYVNGTTGDANGLVFDNVDAGDTTAQTAVVLVRDCEVNAAEITFEASNTPTNIADALNELETAGIIARAALD